jgi:hypothetical protein
MARSSAPTVIGLLQNFLDAIPIAKEKMIAA